jgi:O-antigen/teichoic acid export membrane protein
MEEFLSACALAFTVLSAITFVAYKFPTGFKRLYWPLIALLAFGVVSMGGFAIGIEYTIDKFGPSARTPQATSTVVQLMYSIRLTNIAILVIILCDIYVIFLLFLPEILKEEKPKSDGS